MKKILLVILSMLFSLTALFGCGESVTLYKLPYYDQLDDELGYNDTLFFENEAVTTLGDPTALQVTDPADPHYGWYYMYGTQGSRFDAYRSRDLHSWEWASVAFIADKDSGATYNLWAPEIIYDAEANKADYENLLGEGVSGKGLYFMFFSPYNQYYPKASANAISSMPWRTAKPFINHEQKNKYWYYADWIFSSYKYNENAEASALQLTADTLLSLIEERKEMLVDGEDKKDGVYISDNGIGGGEGYTSVYTEKMIDKALAIVDEAKTFYNNETAKEKMSYRNLIESLQDYLVAVWTTDIVEVDHLTAQQGISIAISQSPEGPFVQYTNDGSDGNRKITKKDWWLCNEDVYEWLFYHRPDWYKGVAGDYGVIEEHYEEDENGDLIYVPEQTVPGQSLTKAVGNSSNRTAYHPADIVCSLNDAAPFVDPVTGDKYLYICKHNNSPDRGFVLGVKIGDKNSKWTDDPQWETLTKLTRQGFYTCDDISTKNYSALDLQEDRWVNEGPFVIYNPESKLYYLTMSSNSYNTIYYTAHTAISESPLGPFRKLTKEEGGALLRADEGWTHIAGPGHHTFVQTQGELWVVYQKHHDPTSGYASGRGVTADKVEWAYNDNGVLVPHVNGPSFSPQPMVGLDKKYDNIASKAIITATNVAKESNTHYLNDGLIRFYSWDEWLKEFSTGSGKETTITLTFNDYYTVRAVMVYNTWDYVYHFDKVDRIEFDFRKSDENGNTTKGTAFIDGLAFDNERYVDDESEVIRPGAAAIAEFEELEVKTIRLTFKSSTPINISEIVVLGK